LIFSEAAEAAMKTELTLPPTPPLASRCYAPFTPLIATPLRHCAIAFISASRLRHCFCAAD